MPDRDELSEIIAELSLNASDRASAILGASVLDGALESVILPKFRKLTEAQIKELFGPDSPLGFTLSAGVRNLLDEEPPYMTSYDDMNTIHFSYDTQGRYYFASGRMSF